MPMPSPRTTQSMIRSLLETAAPGARVAVGFEKTKDGPRWTVVFDPVTGARRFARGAMLDQALRALVVTVRRAQGEKLGR